MKFKVESDGAFKDYECVTYDSLKDLLNDYPSPHDGIRLFLDHKDMDSIMISFGDSWYRYSRVYE